MFLSGAEKTKTFQVADFFDKNFPGEKARKSRFRQFSTNARKSVFCTRFYSHCNEALYYSKVFHWISFQAAWKFPDDLESFQMAWKLSTWPENFTHGLKTLHMAWKLST